MMTILYSVNLRIMGRSNIQLLTVRTFLTPLENLDVNRFIPMIAFFLVVSFGFKFLTDLYLHTQMGLAMRATGDNEQMIRTLGGEHGQHDHPGAGNLQCLCGPVPALWWPRTRGSRTWVWGSA